MLRVTLILAFWAVPAAAGETIVVAPDPCPPLAVYEPSNDVAYRPGVDAHGQVVLPADLDLDRPPLFGLEDIDVVIEVPLIQADRIPQSVRDIDATVEVGTITLDDDGTARFDGVELRPQDLLPLRCE